MKYTLLTIILFLCIVNISKAQTLTDITTNSDQMETIRATGFNWATPSQSTDSLAGRRFRCNHPDCPICNGSGGGGGDWESYSFNWQWQSYLNSFPFPYLGPGTTKAIYLIGENGMSGGSVGGYPETTPYPYWLNIPSPNPPPTTLQTQDSTRIKIDTTKKDKPYYITVDEDTTKYYNDSVIYLLKRSTPVKFTIHKDSTVLDPINYKWKMDGSAIAASGKDSCKITRIIAINYDVALEDNGNKQIEVHVSILEPPYIVFNKKTNFNWEYGWDDDSKNYALLREDFNKEPYAKGYYPKWMSVFHQKTVEVNVDIKQLNKALKKVKGTLVEIKSNNPKIKINNTASLKLDYNALNTIKTINITSDELGSTLTNHLRDSILSVTNNNETIGKLYISCEKPITKKVVFVYVKIANPNYQQNIDSISINFLNTKSHNQIFRQWELVDEYNSNQYFPTTLDLTSKISLINHFSSSTQVSNFIRTEYEKLFFLNSSGLPDSTKPINISTINPNEFHIDNDSLNAQYSNIKTRFMFITDLYQFTLANGDTLAGASKLGGCSGMITMDGQNGITLTHELGHQLALYHTFYDGQNTFPNLPKSKSNNFMDYHDPNSGNSEKRNCFYYYQWSHEINTRLTNTFVGIQFVW